MNTLKANNVNFKSGLSNKILLQERFINPRRQEKIFLHRFGIDTNFNNSKSLSLANKISLSIFEKLFKKLNLSFNFPPALNVFDRINLVEKNSANNFCIPDTKSVLLNDYPFPGRSIFFEKLGNLKYIDDITETQYKNKQTSSSHFLSPFIHEWIHSFHLDYIYKKFGYGGNCHYLKECYPSTDTIINGYTLIENLQSKTLSSQENEVVFSTLGEYSTNPTNQYLEIFSETWTKFICSSLKGTDIIKNPLELFENTPREFQNIFNRICNFK